MDNSGPQEQLNVASGAIGLDVGSLQHAPGAGQDDAISGTEHIEAIYPFVKRMLQILQDTRKWYKTLHRKYNIDLKAWSDSMKVDVEKLQNCIKWVIFMA